MTKTRQAALTFKSWFLIFIFLTFGFFQPMAAKVKVIPGKMENLKTGQFLEPAGEAFLGDFFTATAFKREDLPTFNQVYGDPNLAVLRLDTRSVIVDVANRKLLQRLEGISVVRVYRPKGAGFLLVIHSGEKKRMLSRYDLGSDQPLWTIPFDIQFTFTWGTDKMYRIMPFPMTCMYLAEKDILFLAGITYNQEGKRTAVHNKIMLINAANGRAIKNRDFHYRRHLNKNQGFLVDKVNKTFEVVDWTNGRTVLKGTYTNNDIPDDVRRYEFADHHLVHPLSRTVAAGLPYRDFWDFKPMMTDQGLMISSRNFVNKLKWGVNESHWVIIEPETGRSRPIESPPLGGLDMALRNVSEKTWPVVVPHVPYQSGFKRSTADTFWVIQRDGSMVMFVTPEPLSEKIRFVYTPFDGNAWCHDGEYLYFLHSATPTVLKRTAKPRKLFRMKIGGGRAEEIYSYDDKEIKSHVADGENGYLLLSGLERWILVKVPEGREIEPSEFSDELGTSLYKQIELVKYFHTWVEADNARYLHKHIPKTDLPGNYKTFMFYNFRTKKSDLKRNHKLIYPFTLPTVWGHREWFTDPRDLALMPVRLKDKSTIFAGLHIQKHRALFYLPVARFAASGVQEILAFVAVPNGNEAVLAVLTDLTTLHFYKMTRPI